jgi:hypothetical protein
MEFLKNLNGKQVSVVKAVGIGVGVLVLLVVGSSLVSSGLRGFRMSFPAVAPSSATNMMYGSFGGGTVGKLMMADASMGEIGLSARNVAGIRPPGTPAPTPGADAEAFEVTTYSGRIETRDREATCGTILAWKALPYVIFENANQYKQGCNLVFKVEKAHAEEILAKVRGLQPKDLSENTHTIKRLVDDYTSEEDILKKKRATIEQTLEDALKGYTEITTLATKTQDPETLARVIESKLQTMERLTNERIQVNEQLERLSRAKADELDRLGYVVFSLDVFENKFVDGEQLRDSWKEAVRTFVQDVSQNLQNATIGLVTLLFTVLSYVLYFFFLLVVAKYAWKAAKAVWQK